jgi:hypothetical protein
MPGPILLFGASGASRSDYLDGEVLPPRVGNV